ncbi:LOW QUALITY PROTEIN: sodium/calcium exchanger 1-like [Pristis pectinata]|uniref:LOW QUALITY PROTEIN: sodium/calcium exchanger 1-like n=1 Tax=Pristis pectinata TaxID=685728 RepID=UPI00223D08E8|nr:LOW QUALITY PROTEIN: sodium/calcium exchanger 1-like [Pristis pectinata]
MRRGRGELRMLPAAGLLLAAELCAGAAPTEPPAAFNLSCGGPHGCEPGVILPVWQPPEPSAGDKVARAIVYFVAMVYLFLGMSIIADRFMASIEVITSQEREVTVKRPNGETFTTMVRVWNETVSNLTLMALGSSAPEILLSVIEVCGHNFEAGELGPATIVGSAAFNMFVIIAVCVAVVPGGERRRIKHPRGLFVTASWSIFAYVWLYLILAVWSPAVVEVWEAALTFAFFPCCVLLAWVADRRLLVYKYLHKRYRADKGGGGIGIVVAGEAPKQGVEMDATSERGLPEEEEEEAEEEEEEARRAMARILKELRQRHPDREPEQLMEMASYQALLQQQKSRAFYRIHATRRMTGEGNILKRHAAEQTRRFLSQQAGGGGGGGPGDAEGTARAATCVYFEPAHYQCFEDCGWMHLTVVREGGPADCPLAVDYRTEDGTANAGSDYEAAEGTLRFGPGERRQLLPVRIIDDDIFEQDEYFRVRLSNPRLEGGPEPERERGPVSLGAHSLATVTIFDDDHAGLFAFERPHGRVSESVGTMTARVLRTSGSRGVVLLPYRTVEGTAKAGDDFVSGSGQLVFQNNETV